MLPANDFPRTGKHSLASAFPRLFFGVNGDQHTHATACLVLWPNLRHRLLLINKDVIFDACRISRLAQFRIWPNGNIHYDSDQLDVSAQCTFKRRRDGGMAIVHTLNVDRETKREKS